MPEQEDLGPWELGSLWKHNMGCTSDHLGDAPTAFMGGTNSVGITHYERHFSDGCVHISNFRAFGGGEGVTTDE